jgi:hypothetical protein
LTKRIGVITILSLTLALLLNGCNAIGAIINPIIGTWTTVYWPVTATETYNANGSFTETNSLGSLGITKVGTWKSDDTTLTKIWTDTGISTSYTYTFNSNNSSLTLSLSGVSITYDRQ